MTSRLLIGWFALVIYWICFVCKEPDLEYVQSKVR